MRRLLPIASIEIFVWLILLVITLVISKRAASINFGTRTIVQLIVTEVIRLLASGVLILIWLVSWKKLADIYLRKELSRQTATV